MPMRKPRSDESQQNWMAYCMGELKESDLKQEQKVAACLDAWRNRNKENAVANPSGIPASEVTEWKERLIRLQIIRAEDDDSDKPYGDVDYADPGYQEDGKKRYPVDTETHIRAAWSYINKSENQKPYSRDQVKKIKQRIVAAWRKKIDPDGPPGLEDDEHLGKTARGRKQNMRPQEDETRDEFMERCQDEGESESDCAMMWDERGYKRNRQNDDVPTPREDESRDDFLERCEETLTDDDWDESEATSTCALAWENRSGSGRLRHKTHSEIVEGPDELREFILSDGSIDRMGDIIDPEGWALDAFKNNPVALAFHRADFCVGLWQGLRVEKGALRGHLKLAPEGTSERIDEIRKLVEAGILKAVSVGFRPIESRPRRGAHDRYEGEHFLKQELVETSLVSVPANANALAVAKSLNVSDDTIDLVFAKDGKRTEVRKVVDSFGKHAVTKVSKKGDQTMSLAQRITEAEARVTGLKDQLADHLSNVDDSNVSDTQYQHTKDLHQMIEQQTKLRDALVESEKLLMGAKAHESPPNRALSKIDGNGSAVHAPYVSTRTPAIPKTKEERIELIVRAGVVRMFSHINKVSMDQARIDIAKEPGCGRYNEEATKAFTTYVARAESTPAMTSVTGWAEELVQTLHADYMDLLQPDSIFPRLAAQGLSLSFGRSGRISIPTRNRTPSISGSFVGEGRPIPVRQAAFQAQVLTPRKMAVITTWTREISESSIPAIEGLLRNAIQEDTAITIDSCLLDTDPADAVRPAGLLNGITPIAPTAGGGFNAIVADLRNVTGALLASTAGNIRNMVMLMNPAERLAVSLTAMPGVSAFPFMADVAANRLLGYPLLVSGTVPLHTIVALDAADFVVVGGEAPRFEISDQATLHMDDDVPLPIVDGTAASPVRSLWQTDSIGLRLILPINWCMRRAGMVTAIQGLTW